jgi:hypothetical protein
MGSPYSRKKCDDGFHLFELSRRRHSLPKGGGRSCQSFDRSFMEKTRRTSCEYNWQGQLTEKINAII